MEGKKDEVRLLEGKRSPTGRSCEYMTVPVK